MNNVVKFIFIIFLISTVKAADCDDWPSLDHTNLWPENSIRDQGYVGSCHSFAQASLFEAKYKQLTGKNIDISEADMFQEHYRNNKAISSQVYDHNDNYNEMMGEGGWEHIDFEIIRNMGVCTERAKPYNTLHGQLSNWRQERDQLRNRLKQCPMPSFFDTLKEVYNVTQDSVKVVSKLNEDLKSSNELSCMEERHMTRSFARKLSPYTAYKNSYWTDKGFNNDLMNWLKCGPITIGVKGYGSILGGNVPSGHEGGHAVAIAGYDCKTKKFKIRNSWGGNSYDEIDSKLLLDNIFSIHTISQTDPNKKCDTAEKSPTNFIPGDINGDNIVDGKDLSFLKGVINKGYKVSEKDKILLDINLDGVLDINDLHKMIKVAYETNDQPTKVKKAKHNSITLKRHLTSDEGIEILVDNIKGMQSRSDNPRQKTVSSIMAYQKYEQIEAIINSPDYNPDKHDKIYIELTEMVKQKTGISRAKAYEQYAKIIEDCIRKQNADKSGNISPHQFWKEPARYCGRNKQAPYIYD